MLQRILELATRCSTATTFRAAGRSPGGLGAARRARPTRWMDRFGDNVYNLYGSTEVAWATIATPRDLRAAPGTAGPPAARHRREALRRRRQPVPPGETGPHLRRQRRSQFEGYTGGGNKDEIDGLLSSGDVGHFDDGGRLFIDGRDDDMIVSRRRERVPGRGRGPAAGPRGDRRGGRVRRRRRAVRPAAEGRGRPRGREVSADEVKRTSRRTSPATRSPRDVEFVDELPRTSTGKVLKRELRADTSYEACLSARTSSISRASGSPPARAGGSTSTSRSSRSTTAASATRSSLSWCPCASTSPARPATAGRCGCASTADARRARACAAWSRAAPKFEVDAREVHQPGRATRS